MSIFSSNYKYFPAFLIISIALFSCSPVEKACFTFSPENPAVTDSMLFDVSCSEHTFSYKWSFGDGTPDTLVPGQYEPLAHKYAVPGTYTVHLTANRKDGVTWRKGKTDVSKQITVH